MKNNIRILLAVAFCLIQSQAIRTEDYNVGDDITYVGTLGLFGEKADNKRTIRAEKVKSKHYNKHKHHHHEPVMEEEIVETQVMPEDYRDMPSSYYKKGDMVTYDGN